MKAWSNWLHRQDQKDEEKRIRNRARQRALRQQRRSDRVAGLQQAVRKGPSVRRSWTVSREDPEPRGSIRRVLKQHTKAPRKERTVKLRLVEREVQASRVTAKGEYMVQNRHRAWVAPKRRPRASGSQEPEKVTKGFVEVSLRNARDLTCQPDSVGESGDLTKRAQEVMPGTAYFMKRRPQEKEKVKFTSQVRSLLRPAGNAALSVTDASTSEWMSETADPPVLELTEENLKRLDESVKQRKTPSILPIKAKTRPIGPQPPQVPPPGWQPPAKQPPVAPPKQPPVAPPKQPPVAPPKKPPVQPPAPPATADPEEIPEPKTPSVPGPKTPPTKPKAKSRPLTEEQKAVAEEMLAQKAQDLFRKAERGTATLKREKESSASGSGAKKVPKYLEHLTDEQREHLFRTELSSEQEAGAIEWEKELARREKEEEERRKAKALYRSERMAQALEHGKEISVVGRKSSRRENKISYNGGQKRKIERI